MVLCQIARSLFSIPTLPPLSNLGGRKDLSTPKGRRGHATPHMSVETAKCWLLKIKPNAWAGGKGSCAAGLR